MHHRNFTAKLDCHYYLHLPGNIGSRTPLVVTLHGFGADPQTMLELTNGLFDGRAAVASLQGPNNFFLNAQARDVGFGWITNRHSEGSIRLHHDMVLHVLDEVGRETGIPVKRRLLAGFSQPVGLNYRLAATFPDAVRGVLGICGGLPGDWETGPYQPVKASVLHIARRADEFYPPSVTEHYAERLRLRATDVEFHLLEGSHRIPSNGNQIVNPWLQRIVGD
jgi:predicted esterase